MARSELRERVAQLMCERHTASIPFGERGYTAASDWLEDADAILALVAADREGELAAAQDEYVAQAALLTELRLADRGTRDSSDFQRHRDLWRRYAKTGESRPTEYLSSPVGDDPTIVDTWRPTVAAAVAWGDADANDVNAVLSTGRALREALAALSDAQRDAARRG